jgi:hypothetical protein
MFEFLTILSPCPCFFLSRGKCQLFPLSGLIGSFEVWSYLLSLLFCFIQVIPSAWSTRHFRTLEKKVVILRVKENTWNTNFLYYKSKNSGGLSSGWKSFALDNNLQEFDVCLFEPSGTMNNSFVLDVNIFRVL